MSSEGADLNSSFLQSAARKKEYKHLLKIGGETAENVDNISVVDNLIALKDILTKSNELIGQGTLQDRVGQSAEVVLDAQVCKLASDLMGTTVQKIENNDFSDENFVAALCQYVTDDTKCDWSKLDEIAIKTAKTFYYVPSMFGTFDFENIVDGTQVTEKQRRVRRKADVGVEKRPVAVKEDENPVHQTSKVELVYETIKNVFRENGSKPIPYFQLVIDPTNMMYTFDNTFQVSFLFRDGMIAFVKDDDGLPAIKPISDNAKLKKPNEMTSFTSSLDNALIQKYIKKYKIREPMLKIPRE